MCTVEHAGSITDIHLGIYHKYSWHACTLRIWLQCLYIWLYAYNIKQINTTQLVQSKIVIRSLAATVMLYCDYSARFNVENYDSYNCNIKQLKFYFMHA